jgi:sulfopyruvate decarboxylase alpha subunit
MLIMSDSKMWPEDIFQVLIDHQVRQVAYVPDAGLAKLLHLCSDSGEMRSIPLTTEEEGVALLAGAWLGGQRGVLLMQSSGVGNCINMLSLSRICRMPLLIVVTMRGQRGELNPWQVPMGQISEKVLALAGVITFPVDEPARVGEIVESAARMAFEESMATAVLISQRILGVKTFGK